LTETLLNNLEKHNFQLGKYTRLEGYLSWPKKNSGVQLNIISRGLTKLVAKKEIRADIAWSYDNKTVLVNPHLYGMVKLYEGVGEIYCVADRLVKPNKTHAFFSIAERYHPLEIHWFGDPSQIFYDRIEYQLFKECVRRGLKAQPINTTDSYADIEIENYPLEITTLKPSKCKPNINQEDIIWEGIGTRIIQLTSNKIKTDKASGILLPKEWAKLSELNKYKKILSEKLDITLYFADFSKRNWAKQVLNQIVKKIT
jgi:hypothetical protein